MTTLCITYAEVNNLDIIHKAAFTAVVFLRFLRRRVKQSGRKVFVVVDAHPVHRSRAVRAWLSKNARRIEMFFLPGYSPDFNPDEMLNRDVKTTAVGKRRPRSRPQMMRTVRGYLDCRRRGPELVRRCFHEPSLRYAAA